jgi:hypothetical protein
MRVVVAQVPLITLNHLSARLIKTTTITLIWVVLTE